MSIVFKGNKREIPGDMPPVAWMARVLELCESPRLAHLPWYVEGLEYLPPRDLIRMRAKALVWREVTGSFPTDVSTWWEMRQGRRKGYVGMPTEVYDGEVDENGVMQCGKCKARWSPDGEGNHRPICTLCGSPLRIRELEATA